MLSSISPLSPSSGITIRSHENMRREDRKIETKRKYEEEKMKKIDLCGLSLDSLTNPSINLAVISHLDLSNNNLESIPESLTARLLNLAILDLRSNQLKHLPNSMGCLSKLRILNISGNLIESLPKTIEDCRSLEELNANFNKLIHLPDTIGFELINLKKLSVNSNKLVSLPYSTSHMTSLRVLDARLNCLRSLPEDMENLTNLQILNVSQNFHYLTELPYSIGLLVSLVELDISYNKISTLPPSIGCLRNLEKLCVDGNPLLSPPLEVFEHSLSAVKEYLCDQMNGTMKNVHKKRSWISKIVKHGTFNGFMSHNLREREDRGKFSISEYRSINGIATPKHIGLGMFSPRRLFSPRRYCTTNT